LLGSSDFSAELAAGAGLEFAFAAHINVEGAVPAFRTYRQRFVPSARFGEPRALLAVSVTVGESAEQARELSLVNDLLLLRLRSGRMGSYPTLEEAKAYPFTLAERELIRSMPMRSLVGEVAEVQRQIVDLVERSLADEVMVTTFLPGLVDRRRAIEELARAFGLREREVDRGGLATFAA